MLKKVLLVTIHCKGENWEESLKDGYSNVKGFFPEGQATYYFLIAKRRALSPPLFYTRKPGPWRTRPGVNTHVKRPKPEAEVPLAAYRLRRRPTTFFDVRRYLPLIRRSFAPIVTADLPY